MYTKQQQGGFTLIELVVVITILGILAAFAIPRFISLEEQARFAAVQALGGSVQSGAALAHAMWLASGEPTDVPMDGVAAPGVAVSAEGYPTLASIDDTIADLSGFSYAAATGVFTKTGAPASCTVTYALDGTTGAPIVTVPASSADC